MFKAKRVTNIRAAKICSLSFGYDVAWALAA